MTHVRSSIRKIAEMIEILENTWVDVSWVLILKMSL